MTRLTSRQKHHENRCRACGGTGRTVEQAQTWKLGRGWTARTIRLDCRACGGTGVAR